MEIVLEKLTSHAMNYAIRSGIAITSGYFISQTTKLLQTPSIAQSERTQLAQLQARLESKIRILSPAIDMIELISARGNTSLDSAVALTKAIRLEIQRLGGRLGRILAFETHENDAKGAKKKAINDEMLREVIVDMKGLLEQIEDAVPLINLAITTSGASMSTTLPATVSPSRLLQASTFLSAGDSAYASDPGQPTQIGPVFMLSLYMLFEGHANRIVDHEGARETTWQEVIHKARAKLLRVPLSSFSTIPGTEADPLKTSTLGHSKASRGDLFPKSVPSDGKAHEFAYQLLIIEDLDDDRVHTFEENEEKPGSFDDVALAGIREVIPIHQVSKIFYADTGKILNIGSEGEPNSPVLLLKRDVDASPPRRMVSQSNQSYEDEPDLLETQSTTISQQSVQSRWRFPAGLDPEWMALEVYVEHNDADDSETEDEVEEEASPSARKSSPLDPITSSFSRLGLGRSTTPSTPSKSTTLEPPSASPLPVILSTGRSSQSAPNIKTSLSLLELLVRLTALQQFQQCSHLSISDELLSFFLSESSSTGAGADAERRRALRSQARRTVGFDPYAESPVRERRERDWHRERDDEADLVDEWRTDFPPTSSPVAGWTPASAKGGGSSRMEMLRRENRGSGIVRSSSDSTLGTSPSHPGPKE